MWQLYDIQAFGRNSLDFSRPGSDGLFNVVLGARETGQLLTRHQDISKVSFTGEKNTGIAICKDASDTLKKISMELGGKSPLIVFEDADLTEAVSAAMLANWYSCGEVCSNGNINLVHSPTHSS